MQLHDVDGVRFKTPQTALDALQNGIARPIWRALNPQRVPAFGKQIKFVTATRYGLADRFLTAVITFRGVDHV
jgi:hypothetical protein